jgi:hypothetical protein
MKSGNRRLSRAVKIRAAHEVMAARTTELALLVDQFVAAAQTKAPMFTGNILGRRRMGAGFCHSLF